MTSSNAGVRATVHSTSTAGTLDPLMRVQMTTASAVGSPLATPWANAWLMLPSRADDGRTGQSSPYSTAATALLSRHPADQPGVALDAGRASHGVLRRCPVRLHQCCHGALAPHEPHQLEALMPKPSAICSQKIWPSTPLLQTTTLTGS